MSKLNVQEIYDTVAEDILKNFFNTPPTYFIALLISGYTDEKMVSFYRDFFGKKINDALFVLLREDIEVKSIVYDLANLIVTKQLMIYAKPDIAVINNLWDQKVSELSMFNYNPYETIILACLKYLNIEDAISESHISLSSRYISEILNQFLTQDDRGYYDLEKIEQKITKETSTYLYVEFKDTSFEKFDKETMKAILNEWLNKTDDLLVSNPGAIFTDQHCCSILYNYIQFGSTLGKDANNHLAQTAKRFLSECNVKQEKTFKAAIKDEIEKYKALPIPIKRDLMEYFFNNDKDLELLLK